MSDFWSTIPGAQQQQNPQVQQLRAMIMRELESPEATVPAPDLQPVFPEEELTKRLQRMNQERTLGQVMMASGDSALSPLGKTLAAQNLDEFERRARRDNNVSRYQNWQMRSPGSRVSRLTQTLEALQDDEGANQQKMPVSFVDDMMYDKSQFRGIEEQMAAFKPEYAQMIGRRMAMEGVVPESFEDLSRWLSRSLPGFTDPEMREAALWWADLDAKIIAPWRNDLFGATLTNNEQAAFSQLAMMATSMNPEDIMRRLASLREARKEGARERIILGVGNYGAGHLPTFVRLWGDSLNDGAGVQVGKDGTRRLYNVVESAGNPDVPDVPAPAPVPSGPRQVNVGRYRVPITIEDVD